MTDEEAGRVRDFVGYGRHPPDPKWPGGAHVAVNFVINYEEGGEVSVPDGAPASETALTEGLDRGGQGPRPRRREHVRVRQPRGLLAAAPHVHQAQAALHGVRHRESAGAQPEACAAMREAGWDVAGHGYKWEIHGNMAPDYEREQIRLATESITKTIGTRPAGWYSRYAPSMLTRNLLLDNGYEYDSDTYDDELPYWLKVGQRQQLILPYSVVHNDVRFARQGMTSGDEYLAYIKNAVQCVLEEDPPRMLSFGLHNRIIAHPGRALGLARVLDWLAGQPRVWMTRRLDIARHWKKEHPAP
jgi:peptidoglycan/xylan/chitin deacetylase (PgdA/CDA1 family)